MILTPEQIEQNGEAVKAHQRGEAIEYRYIYINNHEPWRLLTNSPAWSFRAVEYRPAPKPKPPEYVPFTRDTIPMPCVVRVKDNNSRCVVTRSGEVGVLIPGADRDKPIAYYMLLQDYTMDDGTPCGTLVTP